MHSTPSFQRARSDEHKRTRVTAILNSARNRVMRSPFEQCEMTQIASDVGITKAALYRYFRAKELIFVELYQRELELLVEPLSRALNPPDAQALTRTLTERPVFCKLSSILSTVLESPLTVEEATAFKRRVAATLLPAAETLAASANIPIAAAYRWLLQLLAAIIGCWHISNPNALMEKALAVPDLAPFRVSFASTLQQQLAALISELINFRDFPAS